MSTIKPIDGQTVHRIQSGQVIVDLCSVVKELVENSIDAGATRVDIRFKNQGLDSIEVQDNGSGISPNNYESIALKHYTSKLSTYSDLDTLQTFGFRGEALSSLCALSHFSIVTCLTADVPKGTRLEFEPSGKLRGTSVLAAKEGTTVYVEGLFYNLPVRRRELERTIKREWGKVLALLNQYACIQIGMKFTVSQQPSKGKRVVLFSTKGNPTTRENIINVFGAKTINSLIVLDLLLELQPSSTTRHGQDDAAYEIRIQGHVSRPVNGEGRQTPDRQMFFVNGRPCGLPQFAKVFNEVYRSYNLTQAPFVFADIRLDTHLYDVNVSPDKRTILLHDQARMLENLRESLVELFEAQDYTVPISQLSSLRAMPTRKQSTPRQDSSAAPSFPRQNPESDEEVEAAGTSDTGTNSGYGAPGSKAAGLSNRAAAAQPLASAQSSARDGGAVGLINRWVERRTQLSPQIAHSGTPGDFKENPTPKPSPPLVPSATPESSEHESRTKFGQHLTTSMLQSARDQDDLDDGGENDLEATVEPDDLETAGMAVSEVSVWDGIGPTIQTRKRSAVTVEIGTAVNVAPVSKKPKTSDTPWSSLSQSSQRGTRRTNALVPTPSFGGCLAQMFAANAQQNPVPSPTPTYQTEDLEESDEESDELAGPETPEPCDQDDDATNESGEPDDHETEDASDIVSQASEVVPPHVDEDGGEEMLYSASGQDEDNVERLHLDEQGTIPPPLERQENLLRGATKRKDTMLRYVQHIRLDEKSIQSVRSSWADCLARRAPPCMGAHDESGIEVEVEDPEKKLSLTISKADFERMKIVGQFNLGFILALRYADQDAGEGSSDHIYDEIFIIDQHATDEKYNFEQLQAKTVIDSQRLVHPKRLELTAVEEEIVKDNLEALEKNGFILEIDESGDYAVGSRCQLLALPVSRETTFGLPDLEELIAILGENQSTGGAAAPRPSRVRKMFAMRACRSSVMIGKDLTQRQMEKLVRHMGELDKPWNCPHGRPTMRHLTNLRNWDENGWHEDKRPDGTGIPMGLLAQYARR